MRTYNLILILICCAALCGCASVRRGTNAAWVTVDNTSANEYCVRLRLKFDPPEAAMRVNRYRACMDRCCLVSEDAPLDIELNFNQSANREFSETGNTVLFEPETVRITITNFIRSGWLRASATPNVIRPDGTVKLKYLGMYGGT